MIPKAGAQGLPPHDGESVSGTAEMRMENAEIPPSPSNVNGNTLFEAAMNLNAYLKAPHAVLQQCRAQLLYSGHSDLRSMSTFATHGQSTKLATIRHTQGQEQPWGVHGSSCVEYGGQPDALRRPGSGRSIVHGSQIGRAHV